jgi:hypothetical protein
MPVATIREDIGVFFSARTNVVSMERDYMRKLLVKHRMTYEHLPIVQRAIDSGYCFESSKTNHLEFVYFDTNLRRTEYLLVLKSAKWGDEVWLVTFHRTNKDQYKSKARRQKLLRDHK